MSRRTHFLVLCFRRHDGIDGATKMRSAARYRDILQNRREIGMAKGKQKGTREAKKPKKEKIKTIAAAPSQRIGAWHPALGSGKKK
jgi:predicted transposase YdaD